MSDDKRIVVRTTTEFHAVLKGEADRRRRSLNSQVLEILETYFDANRLRVRLSELEKPPSHP